MAFFNELSSHATHPPSAVDVYGAVVGEDFDLLFGGTQRLRQLWFLFIAVTTRTNPLDPRFLRKRDFLTLMRQCRVVAFKGGGRFHSLATPLLEAEVNVIHEAEASRGWSHAKHDPTGRTQSRGSTHRKLTWSAFLLALVAIARRAFRREASPVGAVRLLLAVHVFPHTGTVVASFLSERARGFAPAMDARIRRDRQRAISVVAEGGHGISCVN